MPTKQSPAWPSGRFADCTTSRGARQAKKLDEATKRARPTSKGRAANRQSGQPRLAGRAQAHFGVNQFGARLLRMPSDAVVVHVTTTGFAFTSPFKNDGA